MQKRAVVPPFLYIQRLAADIRIISGTTGVTAMVSGRLARTLRRVICADTVRIADSVTALALVVTCHRVISRARGAGAWIGTATHAWIISRARCAGAWIGTVIVIIVITIIIVVARIITTGCSSGCSACCSTGCPSSRAATVIIIDTTVQHVKYASIIVIIITMTGDQK